jgi:hypothetical protein
MVIRLVSVSDQMPLHEFHRQDKFLYVCDNLHMWEWDIRVRLIP